MRFIPSRRFRGLIVIVALALALWGAYYFLWPTYSRQNYINPAEVRLAVIPYGHDIYEVRRDRVPRLSKRLVAALNAGRTWTRYKQEFDGVMVIHRSGRPSIMVGYPERQERGAMLFTDDARTSGSRAIYRSASLAGALTAIRASKKCLAKPPNIPTRSVSRAVLYAPGFQRTLLGSSPKTRRILSALNEFLSSVDTSFYAILGDPARGSFYLGEVDPHTHLSATSGALLMLNPPLSVHTTMMYWTRQTGPPAEYQEFKTNMVLLSDALCRSDSFSREPRNVVGFSSNARRNRFYLFDAGPPASPAQATEIAEKWNRIIRGIEEALGSLNARTR